MESSHGGPRSNLGPKEQPGTQGATKDREAQITEISQGEAEDQPGRLREQPRRVSEQPWRPRGQPEQPRRPREQPSAQGTARDAIEVEDAQWQLGLAGPGHRDHKVEDAKRQ